jgi:predicted permease
LGKLIRNLRHVLRKLARAPLFTAACVFTLAVGIGANTAIFTVVDGVLLEALPYDDPGSLVGVWHTAPGLGFDEVSQSPALHYTYRAESRVFEDVGMWDDTQVAVTGVGEPEQVPAMLVTDGTLPILRARPLLGRLFTREDDSPGTPETVILGHGYWQRRFGGDRSVVGRPIRINGTEREIIGVLPERFEVLNNEAAVYLPFRFDTTTIFVGNFSYQGLARLRPGATLEQANADVERLIPAAVERYAGPFTMEMVRQAKLGPDVRPLKQDVVGDVANVLWVLLGTVGIVLLIACANVANLFLVRAEGRQRDVAIRTALGAGRRRIAFEFLGESVTLGLAGSFAGTLLAWGGIRLLVSLAPRNLPRLGEIGIDATTLAFTLGISILAGLLFGMFPVLKYGRPHLIGALKESGRANSAGRERHHARNALVVSQVALALVLLIGSGLMIRTFRALRAVDPGFQGPEAVLTVRVSVPTAEVEDGDAAVAVHRQIADRIAQIPGVGAVGLSSSITMDGNDSNDALFVEDHPVPEGQLPPIRRYKFVAPGYFATMGSPLLAGRDLTWDDIGNHAGVAVITENLAREYWGSPEAAIGRRVREFTNTPWREVIGVVADARDNGVDQDAPAIVHWPIAIASFWGDSVRVQRSVGYAIRSDRVGEPGFIDEVRQAVWAVNPNLPLANVRTLQDIFDRSLARTSFTLVMLGIAAAVALLLGAVGLYGVISYIVSQRTREIGVRVALGARQADVGRMVLGQGLALAAAGVAIGLLGAAALTRLMAALLFGVSPVDLATYATVSAGVAVVALLASWLPARKATRVDPIEALRWE